MNIIIFIDEQPDYHPDFLTQIVTSHDIEANFNVYINNDNRIQKNIIKNILEIPAICIFKLLILKSISISSNMLFLLGLNWFYKGSVKNVCKKFEVPYYEIHRPGDLLIYKEVIVGFGPDIILSSNSIIFPSWLLDIPKYGCINRHSGYLPAYRGVLPIMRALLNGDSELWVTIHTMSQNIDRGMVLAERRFSVSSNKLTTLYATAFKLSGSLVVELLRELQINKKLQPRRDINEKGAYYSFPSKREWKLFRRRGFRIA